jgi:hypothetical protein
MDKLLNSIASQLEKIYGILKLKKPRTETSFITEQRSILGLERGPLSLLSTTEELLDRKVAAPV